MLLSPPVTITTSLPASSTIATALSTAACAIWKSPAASPSRCSCEFTVKSGSTLRPWRSKIPCETAAITGNACAPGNIFTLSVVGCAAAPQAASVRAQNRSLRNIGPPPRSERNRVICLGTRREEPMLKRPGMLAIMLACCLIAPASALAQAVPADPQSADAEAKKRDEAEKRAQAKAREEAQLKAKREAVQRAC